MPQVDKIYIFFHQLIYVYMYMYGNCIRLGFFFYFEHSFKFSNVFDFIFLKYKQNVKTPKKTLLFAELNHFILHKYTFKMSNVPNYNKENYAMDAKRYTDSYRPKHIRKKSLCFDTLGPISMDPHTVCPRSNFLWMHYSGRYESFFD